MARQSRKINVSELDFDKIKNNFKEFLRGQSQFSDYDFEGSSLSTLIDVLAYNTHYNALYTNFALNEMFLDSASKRDSVVSIANMLGYVPASSTTSTAKVNVRITNLGANPSNTYTISAYQPFSTQLNGVSYTFYTTSAYTTQLINSEYSFNDIEIKEGTVLTYTYVAAEGARYIVPNKDVDISTLKVVVQPNGTGDGITFIPSNSISNAGSNSSLYFIKEIEDQKYQILFGDGVFGATIDNGDVIKITYLVSRKSAANNAKTFVFSGTKPSGSTIVTTTTTASYGGSEQETLDSIKYNAPRAYSSQDRAVTALDYKNLILKNFQYVDSVSVWGGESNNPPMYGKVFVSAKPEGALLLTRQQKNDIQDFLNYKNVMSISPVMQDPEYLDISLDISVYYDTAKTILSASDIASIVSSTILDYNETDLTKFDAIFRYSKLSRLIDSSNDSILSNITKPILKKYVTPVFGVSNSYSFSIINPIYTSGISGSAFSSNGFYIANSEKYHYLMDDGFGNIVLYYLLKVNDTETKVIVDPKIGTIKYTSGTVNINNLTITSLESGNYLVFYIKPQSYDVVSAFNQIIKIDIADTKVNVIADATSGNQIHSSNYIFTSSRS